MARFFFLLGTGRAKDMTITGFGARAAIALFIIFGMSWILSLAASIVTEVVTLTNYFGTVLSGGKPYSYLWLFGAYLSQPDISAINVFSLIMLAPFSLIGLLILVGFQTRTALIAGALMIAALTFGTMLRQDFTIAWLQLDYALAFFVLLACRSWNAMSIDGMMGRR